MEDLPIVLKNIIYNYVEDLKVANNRKKLLKELDERYLYLDWGKSYRFDIIKDTIKIYYIDYFNVLNIIGYDENRNKKSELILHDECLYTEEFEDGNLLLCIDNEPCNYNLQDDGFLSHYIFCEHCLCEINTLCGYEERVEYFGQCEFCNKNTLRPVWWYDDKMRMDFEKN